MAKKRKSRRNPSVSLRRPLGMITAGFKPSFIKTGVIAAVGIIANRLLVSQLTKFFPSAASGPLSFVAEGLGAGILLAIPKYGTALAGGAGTALALRGLTTYVTPSLGLRGLADDDGEPSYLNDYETSGQLNDYETGMNDYQSVEDEVATMSGSSW